MTSFFRFQRILEQLIVALRDALQVNRVALDTDIPTAALLMNHSMPFLIVAGLTTRHARAGIVITHFCSRAVARCAWL
ncbi:MAG: hypothetical protein CK431_11785 [Mycobacterium sp.]|nr:MAG: hypothetical protein CK431_11785 [Mycobacterium sp.]